MVVGTVSRECNNTLMDTQVRGSQKTTHLVDEQFGWGKLRPRCLQGMNTIRWFVAWLCMFGFVEGAAVNGIVNIILTSLETRFNMTSSQAGLIVSATDIGAIIFVLLVSYIGSQGHRPRCIAGGSMIMGIGSVVFCLPHFIADQYDYRAVGETGNISYVCDYTRENMCLQESISTTYLYIFMIGQAVHGIGFTPMFTLGTAYVDDNAKTESTAIFLGIIYAVTALGVGGGYIGGGQLLTLYVDFNIVDNVDMTTSDPRWVGAWWVGFIITASCFFIFVLPLAGYSNHLPGMKEIRDVKLEREQKTEPDNTTLSQKILQFPKSILKLIMIPTYSLVVLGACAETLIIGGLAAFSPKILEEKFDILPSDAGFIMGGITLLGGAGGMMLGGVLIRRFKLGVVGMVRLCVILSLLTIVVGGGLFIGCPEVDFAGVTTEYVTRMNIEVVNLDNECNTGCGCDTQKFEPVCGSDSVLYFTPCHAGCSYDYLIDQQHLTKIYNNCTCVTASLQQLSGFSSVTGTARTGLCTSSCDVMYLFILLLFVAMLMTFTTVTPASMAILRCVPEDLRALGLGLQWVCLRLLGTIPGPVLAGSVIDSACALWQDICGSQGSCWFYDRFEMSWRLFTWWIALKFFSSLMFFASGKLHRSQNSDLESDDEDYEKEEINQNENKEVILGENVIHGLAHM